MRRRTVLLGTGVAFSLSIAGCADDAGSDDDNGNGADDTDTGTDDSNGEEDSADDDDDTADEGADDAAGDDGDEDDEETGDEETGASIGGLEITDDELTEDDFWVWVNGIVANNTGEELGSVEVTVTFYDENGEELEESVTSTTGLEDEEEWAFEVMEDGEDIADYSVAITDAVPAERTPT